jgi:hypothetical protein
MGMMRQFGGGGQFRIVQPVFLPDCNLLEVFYWSIEIRVNATGFSAKIAETLLRLCRDAPRRHAGRVGQRKPIKAVTMADLLNLVMLICASIGSMAFGLLAAYGILRVGFALMRPQARPAASVKARPEVARVL